MISKVNLKYVQLDGAICLYARRSSPWAFQSLLPSWKQKRKNSRPKHTALKVHAAECSPSTPPSVNRDYSLPIPCKKKTPRPYSALSTSGSPLGSSILITVRSSALFVVAISHTAWPVRYEVFDKLFWEKTKVEVGCGATRVNSEALESVSVSMEGRL